MHEEDRAPAFVLAKAGYDVWLGNWRGNKYSRGKLGYIDPDRNPKRFFAFSWPAMGRSDAPTMLEYVRTKTRK